MRSLPLDCTYSRRTSLPFRYSNCHFLCPIPRATLQVTRCVGLVDLRETGRHRVSGLRWLSRSPQGAAVSSLAAASLMAASGQIVRPEALEHPRFRGDHLRVVHAAIQNFRGCPARSGDKARLEFHPT
jgi:hypothetical protein